MISKAYEKADFTVVEFDFEDVLTASNVVHTTQPSTTLPATTSNSGVNIGKPGEGGAEFDYSDFFQ
jgi:hypothetical protein